MNGKWRKQQGYRLRIVTVTSQVLLLNKYILNQWFGVQRPSTEWAMPLFRSSVWQDYVKGCMPRESSRGGKNFSSPFLMSLTGPKNQIDKNRLKMKRMQIYLTQVLCDMGAFVRKWRLKEMVKHECFYTKFDEEWKIVEKKKKRAWAKSSKLGKLRMACSLRSLFRDKNAPFKMIFWKNITWHEKINKWK